VPTQKADLSRLSLTQLQELTGRHPTTIRKRLSGLKPIAKDGRTIWYAPREALPLLVGSAGLDLTAERARLAKEQADGQELKNALARADLVLPDAMDRATIALATAVSSRLQAIGTRTAPALAVERSVPGCQKIVDAAVDQALHELADAADEAKERAA
jgi:phage terminase Nu1 subunit (DNA packaging protein)